MIRKTSANWILARGLSQQLIFGWFLGTQQDLWVIVYIIFDHTFG